MSDTDYDSNSEIILDSTARNQFEAGQIEQCEETLNRALSIASRDNHRELQASALNNLGLIHKSRGQFLEALDFYQRALAIYQQLDNRLAQAEVLENIGFVYGHRFQFSEALEVYRDALSTYVNLHYSEGENRARENIESIEGKSQGSDESNSEDGGVMMKPLLDTIWKLLPTPNP